MTKFQCIIGAALCLASPVASFAPLAGSQTPSSSLSMSSEPEDEEPRLVLGDMESAMKDVRAGSGEDFDFGGIDFLANAKARAAAKAESNNNVAGDEEWSSLAEEKKEQFGEIDDWENSAKEAGNTDSQILMFTDPPAEGEGGEGEDDEPKLLLF
jgi:hypothetical protein